MSKSVVVHIVGDSDHLQKAFKRAGASADAFGRSVGGKAAAGLMTLAKAAAVAAVAIGVAGVAVLKKGVTSLIEHERALAQTAAAIKSTGAAANVTAAHVKNYADTLEKLTGVDDLLIQDGQNLLLTFTGIRNEVGKGNDIFDRATKTALDLSVVLGKDMSSSAMMLGKALNDPVKGMTALGRAGVQFTQEQKDAIEAMVKTGDVLGAQKLILAEVEKQVGGSAKAYGTTFAGQVGVLKARFEEFSESVAKKVMPTLTRGLEALNKLMAKVGKQKGLQAKLEVIFEAAKDAGQKLQKALAAKVKEIDWAKVWAGATSMGASLATELQEQVGRVDWSRLFQRGEGLASSFAQQAEDGLSRVDWAKLGQTISGKLFAGLTFAADKIDALVNFIADGLERNAPRLATAGAVIATNLFLTLVDPAFWAEHWDLALAVGLVAFAGSIGRSAVKLVGPLLAAFAPAFEKLGLAIGGFLWHVIVSAFSSLPGRLAALLKVGMAMAIVHAFADAVVAAASGARRIVEAIGNGLNALATAIRTKLDAGARAIANFAQTAYAKAKEIGTRIIQGIVGGLSTLVASVTGYLGRIGGAIRGVASHAFGWALGIGSAIVSGILSGLSGLVSRVAGAIAGGVRDAIDWAKGHIGSTAEEAAAEKLGRPLARGVILGWLAGTAELPSAISDTIRKALDKAKAVVDAARSTFQTAFSQLSSDLMSAFDRQSQAHLTASERALKELQDSHDAAARAQAKADAEMRLAQATTDEERAAAQKDLDQIMYDEQVRALEAQAANERQNYEDRRQLQKRHFELLLARLQEKLESGRLKVGDFNRRVLALMTRFGVDLGASGSTAGAGFVALLMASLAGAVSGAQGVAAAIAAALGGSGGGGGAGGGSGGGGGGGAPPASSGTQAQPDTPFSARGFNWGGQFWGPEDKASFTRWLDQHGSSFHQWLQKPMQLALARLVGWAGSGGVVTRPTIVGVGERGPEAIIPLSRLGAGRGGGQPVVVNVTVQGSVWRERDLVQAIREGLLSGPGTANPSLWGARA